MKVLVLTVHLMVSCCTLSVILSCLQVCQVVWNEIFQGGPPDIYSSDVSASHNPQLGAMAGQQVCSGIDHSSQVSYLLSVHHNVAGSYLYLCIITVLNVEYEYSE